jgi:hypothetical protein
VGNRHCPDALLQIEHSAIPDRPPTPRRCRRSIPVRVVSAPILLRSITLVARTLLCREDFRKLKSGILNLEFGIAALARCGTLGRVISYSDKRTVWLKNELIFYVELSTCWY